MIIPFNESAYFSSLARLGATEAQLKALKHCITSALSGFESSSRSMPGICHSIKMRSTLPLGSSLENAARWTQEVNPKVSGVFWKCGELKLTITKPDGKCSTIRHLPDCVVLYELPDKAPEIFDLSKYVRFVEFKSLGWLRQRAQLTDQYQLADGGTLYRSPAAEKAALELYGYGYDVAHDRQTEYVDPLVIGNMEVLRAYFDRRLKALSPQLVDQVVCAVAQEQGISFPELLAAVPGISSDIFFQMVAQQKVFVPLDRCQLEMPSTVRIFTNALTAEAFRAMADPRQPRPKLAVREGFPKLEPGEILTVKGRNLTVCCTTAGEVTLKDSAGFDEVISKETLEHLVKARQVSSLGRPVNQVDAARKILLSTNPFEVGNAATRYALIAGIIEGRRKLRDVQQVLPGAKTWLKRARDAFLRYGNGFIGCIANRAGQGWHGSHLPPEADRIIEVSIDEFYLTARSSKKSIAYEQYRELCRSKSLTPVSLKTFNKRIAQRLETEILKKREGAGAAVEAEAPVDSDSPSGPVGRYFMHVVHGDSFVVDLALLFPELGIPLGTAWAVVMLDCYTRTILAITLTFEAPSYATTMLLLRECVRRWGRLPETLVLDNGAEFKNISLRLFAKYAGMDLRYRPRGKPRWGAEIERLVKDITERLLSELQGSTKLLKKYRALSESHHPDTLAAFAIGGIEEIMRDWCYKIFDGLPHTGLHGKAPNEMRDLSLKACGQRAHLKIADDPLFVIFSLPAPEGDGTAKVQRHDGVQVSNLYYWHERFLEPEVVGSRVQVRWDPLDITHVYAFVRDEWIECECIKLRPLKKLDRLHLCAVSLEIRRGRKELNRRRQDIIQQVSKFLDSARENGDNQQYLRNMESAKQMLKVMIPTIEALPESLSATTENTAAPAMPPGMTGGVL
jgi:transposase InsO family protein